VSQMTSAGSERPIWRRLPDSDAGMDWQLAHTEALFTGLAEGAPPTLRWYMPAHPALVLGRSQGPERADSAAARAAGVAIYGRTSGGGAVLVDESALSLDIALPSGHPLAAHDVTYSYRWIGEIWAAALRDLGIPGARTIPTAEVRAIPALAPDDPLRLACYGTLSPWEVVVDRRKVVGLSQVRRRPGTIYAIGVHLRWRPERLVELLAVSSDARPAFAARLRRVAAGLDELAGRAISAAAVRATVERALQEQAGILLTPGDWTASEHQAAQQLHEPTPGAPARSAARSAESDATGGR
jgi:lipoate-protein ligase A